jgi:hypothetical protein
MNTAKRIRAASDEGDCVSYIRDVAVQMAQAGKISAYDAKLIELLANLGAAVNGERAWHVDLVVAELKATFHFKE